jgi:hypothetical protein
MAERGALLTTLAPGFFRFRHFNDLQSGNDRPGRAKCTLLSPSKPRFVTP